VNTESRAEAPSIVSQARLLASSSEITAMMVAGAPEIAMMARSQIDTGSSGASSQSATPTSEPGSTMLRIDITQNDAS